MTIFNLLRLLPAVRELLVENRSLKYDLAACRASHEELVSEKLLLESRLDTALAEKDRLWAAMQEALASERTAYRMQVNEAWQRRGAGMPFPSAPHAPESAETQEQVQIGRKGRILPSESIARNNSRVIGELVDRMNPANRA